MPRSPSISVCNRALSKVRAGSIVSVDEGSPEANACQTHYDDCLQLLLEVHPWGFARRRAQLALLVDNDRPDQGMFAYAKPDDMSSAVGVIWSLTAPLNTVVAPWYPWGDGCRNEAHLPSAFTQYAISGDVIYSNIEQAAIEYISRDVEEGDMPATFKDALACALAAELAYSLVSDRTLKGDLIQQAEAAKRRAMAEDLNRQPRGTPSTDVAAVRRGAYPSYPPPGIAINPGIPLDGDPGDLAGLIE